MSSNANIPGDPSDTNDFYDAAPLEPHLFYQGEILTGVPILNMPKPSRWLLLRTRSGKPLDEALEHGKLGGLAKVLDSNLTKEEWATTGDGDFAVARLSRLPVLILSQTCDIETKPFVQVAPVFSAEGDSKYIEKLKANLVISAFWLKQHPPQLPNESYADFELIQAVHQSYMKDIAPEKHFRLGAARCRQLQRSITRYFGRPNSFDAGGDTAPTGAVYLCTTCFYMDGRVTECSLPEGAPFFLCQVCGGRGWVAKGRP
ncbi:MAG TPA: hypothetical protein VGR50_07455 [Terriglobales bacterium]|nr:hypothetical protein [Terriglobales bacterium]